MQPKIRAHRKLKTPERNLFLWDAIIFGALQGLRQNQRPRQTARPSATTANPFPAGLRNIDADFYEKRNLSL
jgi:hypothetical protein